jgi:dipeptidase D
MSNKFEGLKPQKVWQYFAEMSMIPRGSKKEEKIIKFMEQFGKDLGLETIVEEVGNVIIKKDATAGMEDRKTVVLQGHIDMVHQKNGDVDFDFDNDPINAYVDGEWVTAEGTTLGADNGIGSSSIMTILASDDIPHPAIEALFTIDEETGMTGAKGLGKDSLTGEILLNLDSEEDDELTIGCAGGVNTTADLEYEEEVLPEGYNTYKLTIKGLRGGHSGIDIHLGRGNANKILIRFLFQAMENYGLRIAKIDGGGLRNAIPREAFALVCIPQEKTTPFMEYFENMRSEILDEFKVPEPKLTIILEATGSATKVLSVDGHQDIVHSIHAVFNGVFRMTPDIPGLVETSSNLSRILAQDGKFRMESLQRSSIESGKMEVVNTVKSAFLTSGAIMDNDSDYPGWAPSSNSEILQVMIQSYEELNGEKPKVLACHAGLECGIIGKHYPNMDMISFGPIIQHPHSPDEKINIASVQKFWGLLLDVLTKIPKKAEAV